MHVSDEQLESLWSELVNKDGTRAPSDVVLAFASLGGSDPLTESIISAPISASHVRFLDPDGRHIGANWSGESLQ
jgi:hypothetical protein